MRKGGKFSAPQAKPRSIGRPANDNAVLSPAPVRLKASIPTVVDIAALGIAITFFAIAASVKWWHMMGVKL